MREAIAQSGVANTSSTGSQGGGVLSLTQQGPLFDIPNVYFSGTVSQSRGKAEFNGWTEQLDTVISSPELGTIRSTTADYTLRLGRSFDLENLANAQITPFFQYSYHSWTDYLLTEGAVPNAYTDTAAAFGLLFQYALTSQIVVKLDATVGQSIWQKVDHPGFPDFMLRSRATGSLGWGVDYALSSTVHANLDFNLSHFQYGKSGPYSVNSQTLFEPNSETTARDVMAGTGLHF